jgi:hypothetical protein
MLHAIHISIDPIQWTCESEQSVLQAKLPAVRVESLEFQPKASIHQQSSTMPLKSFFMKKPFFQLQSGGTQIPL